MAPGPSLSGAWTQFFPPKPHFTEKDVPDLTGKICLVSGCNSGIGKEIMRILYSKNAKVYAAARSEPKALNAIEDIKKAVPSSKGALVFLNLDLGDLPKVKIAANAFLAQEQKLNVLFNNAGVMGGTSKTPVLTPQGHELTLGVNCIGTLLFTELLTPALTAAARSAPAGSVRVVWPSSFGLEQYAPEGMVLDNLDYHVPRPGIERYGISKCGVWALAVEYARRRAAAGIVSVPINPGNARTELARDQSAALKFIAGRIVYPPHYGAYSALFAAFSPEVTLQTDWSKTWLIPFGRFRDLRPDLPGATKTEAEGGTGGTAKFWDWTEEKIKAYL